MNQADNIRRMIRELANNGIETVLAEVKAVDETARTCDVLPVGDNANLLDVRLRAVDDGATSGLVLIPKMDSLVIVSRIGGQDEEWYVAMFSIVEKVLLEIGQTQMQVDQAGFLLKRQNETLHKVLTDLVNAVQQLVLLTSVGPTTGIQPTSLQALETVKNSINKLLKTA